MTKVLLMLTCGSSALALAAQGARAATASAAGASASVGSVTEIVVQAERREQSLQRVPVAVSVFTGAERDVIGIQSVQDVTNFAPGFTYDPSDVHAYIRGLGRQSINVTDDSRVASYEDSFYVYSPYELDKSDLFLSQEQIERGPQNIGGKNAEGGSIDMISVRPTEKPYAEARFNVANYGVYNFEAAASGQVLPGLDVRLAGYDHNQNQGWWNNLVNGLSEGNEIHEWYVEGQVEWKPNDNADLWVRGFLSGWHNRGDAGARAGFTNNSWNQTNLTDGNLFAGASLFANPNFGYAALPNLPAQAAALANPANEIFDPVSGAPIGPYVPTSVNLAKPGIVDNPSLSNPRNFADLLPTDVTLSGYNGINGIFTYNFPDAGFELKYITGYQQYNYTLNFSEPDTNVTSYTLGFPTLGGIGTLTGAPPLVINPLVVLTYIEDDQWWSHELVLQSTNNSPLQWTTGLFYYQQHYINPITAVAPDQPQFATPMGAPPNPQQYMFFQTYDFTYQSAAGYGEVSYKLNDQFTLTGNMRYTWDHKWGTEASRYIYFGSQVIDGFGPFFGAATPSLDITSSQVCPTGIGVSGSPSCLAGPLAKGVTSIGVIGPGGFATRQLGDTSSAVTGGAKLEWTPTNDILAYARYDRGYEAMSFNAGTVSNNPEALPEYINSFQVGYKQAFGKQLLADVDAFYYDYDNLQVPLTVSNQGVLLSEFINVPKAMSAGVELELYWTPVRDLSITGTYSFDYSEVRTGCNGTVTGGILTPSPGSLCVEDTNDPAAVHPEANPFPGQDFVASGGILQSVKGQALPEAPLHKVGLDVAYTWHYQPGDLTFSAAFVYRSSMDGTLFNRPYDNSPGWTDVDIRALWKGPGDKYEVIAYVKNIFDSLQFEAAEQGIGLTGTASRFTTAPQGLFWSNTFTLAPPRTFGMEFRYRFF